MPPGTISRMGVWPDSAPIKSEKSTTELNGPHFIELENFRIQIIGSLKHVINIIICIRDTGCYTQARLWHDVKFHDLGVPHLGCRARRRPGRERYNTFPSGKHSHDGLWSTPPTGEVPHV
jgi:hypothetical protein